MLLGNRDLLLVADRLNQHFVNSDHKGMNVKAVNLHRKLPHLSFNIVDTNKE